MEFYSAIKDSFLCVLHFLFFLNSAFESLELSSYFSKEIEVNVCLYQNKIPFRQGLTLTLLCIRTNVIELYGIPHLATTLSIFSYNIQNILESLAIFTVTFTERYPQKIISNVCNNLSPIFRKFIGSKNVFIVFVNKLGFLE